MKIIGILALSLITSGFYRGHVWGTTSTPYSRVDVKTCDGEWAAIYADKSLTTEVANPLYSDSKGQFSVYTTSRCTVIGGEGK